MTVQFPDLEQAQKSGGVKLVLWDQTSPTACVWRLVEQYVGYIVMVIFNGGWNSRVPRNNNRHDAIIWYLVQLYWIHHVWGVRDVLLNLYWWCKSNNPMINVREKWRAIKNGQSRDTYNMQWWTQDTTKTNHTKQITQHRKLQ